MTGWKRSPRLSARLRRWIAIPKLEDLERREAPVSATVPIALLGAAALVHTAEPPNQTHDEEKHSAVFAYAAKDLPTEEDKALADLVFRYPTAQDGSCPEVACFLAATDQLSAADDDAEQPTANDPSLDPVMAVGNALVDPVSHPDSSPGDGDKSGSHYAAPPAGNGLNGNAPNLAGAYAGAGQGPGGASTPFTPGGGSSGGGSSGGGGGNLHLPSPTQLQQMTQGTGGQVAAAPTAPIHAPQGTPQHAVTTPSGPAGETPLASGRGSGSGTGSPISGHSVTSNSLSSAVAAAAARVAARPCTSVRHPMTWPRTPAAAPAAASPWKSISAPLPARR